MSLESSLAADDPIWYFAYGTNTAHTGFVTRLKLDPLETRRDVVIPNYELAFDLLGVPYNEPALANLRSRYGRAVGEYQPVRGVAHRITKTDLARVVASEEGGIAYTLVSLLAMTSDGAKFPVFSLVARWPSSRPRCPSDRYLARILSGAQEQALEQDYQESLTRTWLFVPGTSHRYRLGSALFNAFWLRVQHGLQKSTTRLRDDTGNLPRWFVFLFDLQLWSMWMYHDYVHAILWPRGDGL